MGRGGTNTLTVHGWDILPPSRRESGGDRVDQTQEGARETTGGTWRQEQPSGIQATVMMTNHGGADGGRIHGGGRADQCGRAGGGGARGRDEELMSKGLREDP